MFKCHECEKDFVVLDDQDLIVESDEIVMCSEKCKVLFFEKL